ncbi:Putative Heterogeneous nuclear ribonucleoprotein [Chondrus crispus]|uniref:Putative Heterogeneous nuclear ribonucleoprotein n=1 Tax=Chondrus crispus TaxID=2769 RepID=R7QHG3_CHOCR|nr:Putative Heterogeneous nuclear ribonucleoprotein [Chondrus crispus]CDF36906.1 Putative Heterogeneous nuclear ribonucleoprotein [Chondrus crispus]|eukprot:XP_005716725.1 Putative Heterogeneous nuclear ribonucleoprotein [Chondrus crispus]
MATLHPPTVDGPSPTAAAPEPRSADPPAPDQNWPSDSADPSAPAPTDNSEQVKGEDEILYGQSAQASQSNHIPQSQHSGDPSQPNPQQPSDPTALAAAALYQQQQQLHSQQSQPFSQQQQQHYMQHQDPSGQAPAPPNPNQGPAGPSSNSGAGSKIFVGGLSWETGEESLRRYFEQIGTVTDCVIMRDRHTGHPRGFGFVTFADDDAAGAAASRRHDLDGRQVEAKRAVPRNEGAHHTTKCKVFVGGLPSSCGPDEFRAYFSQFGEVVDAQVMIDHNTGNSRGFGFVTFGSEATVNSVVGPGKSNTDHEIMGKCVEVKRAEPKGAPNDRRNNRDNYSSGGGGGGMRASGGNAEGMSGSNANGGGTNAAAAAAAAYYSNYPASLAEQYGAYYNSPQWQQYYAAMGYNFNAYPQGYNPYQQYLQAYMNNAANAANGGSGGGTMPSGGSGDAAGTGGTGGGGTSGGTSGYDNNQGGAGRYGGGAGGDIAGNAPQNGHGSGGNNSGPGPGSRRSSRRDDRYHPYR